MNKLQRELTAVKQKEWDAINGNRVVEEAKQLLLGAHDESAGVLASLGLDHHIQFERKLTSDVVRSAKATEIYNAESFTGKQIREICNTYYMKLLPSSSYNGKVPSDLGRIVAKFAAANDVEINDNDFFILAPIEMFNTVEHVPVKPQPVDPILFYRDRKGRQTSHMPKQAQAEDVFLAVHNWGNDFTWMRKLKVLFSGYRHEHDDTSPRFWTIFSLFLATVSVILGIFGNFQTSVVFVAIAAAMMFTFNVRSKYAIDTQWNGEKV